MELGRKGEYNPKVGITVVNINQRSLRHMGYQSLSEWIAASKDHLYIGRHTTDSPGAPIKASIWENPYLVRTYGIDDSLNRYADRIIQRIDECMVPNDLWSRLDEL